MLISVSSSSRVMFVHSIITLFVCFQSSPPQSLPQIQGKTANTQEVEWLFFISSFSDFRCFHSDHPVWGASQMGDQFAAADWRASDQWQARVWVWHPAFSTAASLSLQHRLAVDGWGPITTVTTTDFPQVLKWRRPADGSDCCCVAVGLAMGCSYCVWSQSTGSWRVGNWNTRHCWENPVW